MGIQDESNFGRDAGFRLWFRFPRCQVGTFHVQRGFLFLLGADTVPQNPQLCFGVDFAYFARVVERGQAVHLQLAKCWGMANLQFG